MKVDMSLVRTLMRLCAVAILIFAVQIQAGRFDYGSFGEAQAAANSMSQFVDKPVGTHFALLEPGFTNNIAYHIYA